MWPARSSHRFSPIRRPFLEHLEELRWRLAASLAAIAIFSLVSTFFSKSLLEFLISPLRSTGGYTLYFQSPHEGFLTYLKVSVFAGILGASPVLFMELWLFVIPGLHRRERKLAVLLISLSTVLFLTGAAFAFWVLVPWGLGFFLGFQTDSLRPLLGIGAYFSFLWGIVLASGLAFDLPVVILGLVRLGILDPKALKRARRLVIVLCFVIAGVITPTTDPATQILLTLPLLLLYEGCVLLSGWVGREKKRTPLDPSFTFSPPEDLTG